MRAAVLHSIEDGKISIQDDVEAFGPGPGQVRIKLRASGVCHSDLSALNGGLPQPLPAILGHEAAGDIVAVGEGVDDLAVGDRVIANWLPACGTCSHCVRREPYYCMTHVLMAYVAPGFMAGDGPVFGMAGVGAFAEEIVVNRLGAIKIDDDVPYDVACLIGCGVMTGVGSVINTAKVFPGAKVAIIGCGGVGISAIQGAKISGAATIVAVDVNESKHDIARRFGATHATSPDGLGDLVGSLTNGEGFDYVFDVVGLPQTIREAWTATRRGGQVILVGAGRSDHTIEFTPFDLLFEGKMIVPSMFGSADPVRDFPRLVELYRAGLLDVEGMISHRLRLDDVREALANLGRGDVIRQVIIHD
jgi:S-(hydroxymethyl)glutathione dehydrogenase/alcohol dehydrogenase